MLFDTYTAEQVEQLLSRCQPESDPATLAAMLAIQEHLCDELIGIVKARQKNTKSSVRYLQPDDLRFGTHGHVASWRAKRLACDMLIEIGAGVGMQTIAFAQTCTHVIAIEIDKRKLAYCRENCKAAGVTNVEFICGDAMNVVDKLPTPDVVFLDPARPAEEESRDLHTSFSPPIHEFVERYSKLTDAIAIELPPHIHDIDIECEQEYISLNGDLRRLTLYMGRLAKCERSAVALPAQARIEGTAAALPAAGELQTYLYEVDEAIVRAQLVPALLGDHAHVFSSHKHVLATSVRNIASPFFRNTFMVLASCTPSDTNIKEALANVRAKSVVLRSSVDPSKYWSERAKYEKELRGFQNVHLFILPDIAIVAKKVSSTVVR